MASRFPGDTKLILALLPFALAGVVLWEIGNWVRLWQFLGLMQ